MIVAMKKVYRQPLAAFVEIATCGVIVVSGGAGGSGSSIGSGTVDPGEAWAGEARNDWTNIWNGI
jgi:hypothetical protein